MNADRSAFQPGDRVRVIDLDKAGRVVEIVGDQALVVVDLHGQSDRITSRLANLEHLD